MPSIRILEPDSIILPNTSPLHPRTKHLLVAVLCLAAALPLFYVGAAIALTMVFGGMTATRTLVAFALGFAWLGAVGFTVLKFAHAVAGLRGGRGGERETAAAAAVVVGIGARRGGRGDEESDLDFDPRGPPPAYED